MALFIVYTITNASIRLDHIDIDIEGPGRSRGASASSKPTL
jgi:hypothetical protein